MPSFDLIIFDCDGVLIDSEVLACGAVQRQLQLHGLDMAPAAVMEQFLGRSVDAVARHYQASLGRTLPESFVPALRREMQAAFSSGLVAMPHVETLLRRLTGAYCLASSSDLERISFSLNLTALSSYFEGRIFTAGMVAHAKPAPDLFLLAAEKLGCDPGACLVIEDSSTGVEAGKAAGMTVWGFLGGSHYAGRDGETHLRAAGADRVFSHMAEIEAALLAEKVAG